MDREERQKILRDLAGKSFLRHDVRIPGRAYESDMKRQVIDRVFEVWLMNPDMRLGQLLMNMYKELQRDDLYYVEDFPLIEALEAFYECDKTL